MQADHVTVGILILYMGIWKINFQKRKFDGLHNLIKYFFTLKKSLNFQKKSKNCQKIDPVVRKKDTIFLFFLKYLIFPKKF
jgi:hypothetical protein